MHTLLIVDDPVLDKAIAELEETRAQNARFAGNGERNF